jgi:hypothetical protein
MAHVADPAVQQDLALRLRVWNPEAPEAGLTDVAHLRYLPGTPPPVTFTSPTTVWWQSPQAGIALAGRCTAGAGDVSLSGDLLAAPVRVPCGQSGAWAATVTIPEPGSGTLRLAQLAPYADVGEAQVELHVSRTVFFDAATGRKALAIRFPAGGLAEIAGRCVSGVEVEISGEIVGGVQVTPCTGDAFSLTATPLFATSASAVRVEQRQGGAVLGEDDATLLAAPTITNAFATGVPGDWSLAIEGGCNEAVPVGVAAFFAMLVETQTACDAGSFAAVIEGLTTEVPQIPAVIQRIPCAELLGCTYLETGDPVAPPGP